MKKEIKSFNQPWANQPFQRLMLSHFSPSHKVDWCSPFTILHLLDNSNPVYSNLNLIYKLLNQFEQMLARAQHIYKHAPQLTLMITLVQRRTVLLLLPLQPPPPCVLFISRLFLWLRFYSLPAFSPEDTVKAGNQQSSTQNAAIKME